MKRVKFAHSFRKPTAAAAKRTMRKSRHRVVAPRKKTRGLWNGEATDLDRLNAGRDPRQTHFFFYADVNLSPNPT
jgi:hypothetical protein